MVEKRNVSYRHSNKKQHFKPSEGIHTTFKRAQCVCLSANTLTFTCLRVQEYIGAEHNFYGHTQKVMNTAPMNGMHLLLTYMYMHLKAVHNNNCHITKWRKERNNNSPSPLVSDKCLHWWPWIAHIVNTHTCTQTHIQTCWQDVTSRANTHLEPHKLQQHELTTAPSPSPVLHVHCICHQPALLHPGMQKMIGWTTMRTLFRLQYQTSRQDDYTTTSPPPCRHSKSISK